MTTIKVTAQPRIRSLVSFVTPDLALVQPFKQHIRLSLGDVIWLANGRGFDFDSNLSMYCTIQITFRFLVLIGLLVGYQQILSAQTVRPPTPTPSITAEKATPGSEEQAPTSLDYEMRAKRAIRYAEKEHQDNLTRAKEASQLGSQLAAAFKSQQALNSSDLKKLEKLEKLTKKIRTDAGASDDEFVLEHKPENLAAAVESVEKVSCSMSEKVLKTPRQVVSTAIIEEANVLLELIRIVRNFAR